MATRYELPIIPADWDTVANPQAGLNGYTYSRFAADEARSAAQKAVRRGYRDEAVQWFLELFWTGTASRTNIWNRALVMALEDVGLGAPEILPQIWSLFTTARDDPVALATAAVLLAEAPKCRVNDWLMMITVSLRDPAVANAVVEREGGLEELARKFRAAFAGRDTSLAVFYSKTMFCTTLKLSGRGNKLHQQIWDIMGETVSGPYFETLREIYNSKNWKPNSGNSRGSNKARLLICHCIEMWMYAEFPTSVEPIVPDRSLAPLVERFRVRDPTLVVGIPDYAVDKHTRRGKRQGQGAAQFFQVGSVLNNRDPNYIELDDTLRVLVERERVPGAAVDEEIEEEV